MRSARRAPSTPPAPAITHKLKASVPSMTSNIPAYLAQPSALDPSLPPAPSTNLSPATEHTRLSTPSDSSSSSSAPSPATLCKMPYAPYKTTGLAMFVQDGSKCPSITAGNISVKVMFEFKKGAQKYFNNKEIPKDKQVKKILDCFDNHRIADWISIYHKYLEVFTFLEFMSELCSLYLQPLWEEMMHVKFLSLSQGTKPFWDFTTEVQKTNALL